MKKQIVITALSLLLIITCFLAACGIDSNQSLFPAETVQNSKKPSSSEPSSAILELEARIEELLNMQSSSDKEYSKELEALRAELEALKKAEETKESPETETEKVPSKPSAEFIYTVENGEATITGYKGDDTHIAIPSAIDGFTVTKIGEKAFSSKKIKSVVIPNGISRIDWFAFEGCTSLESVTIPESVTSIGYSAFSSTAKSFTIYCHVGSFAQNYAKSYGLSYAII